MQQNTKGTMAGERWRAWDSANKTAVAKEILSSEIKHNDIAFALVRTHYEKAQDNLVPIKDLSALRMKDAHEVAKGEMSLDSKNLA